MSLKKSGIVILATVLLITGGSELQAQENEYAGGGNTKLFTVFVSKGCSCPGPGGRVAEGLTTNDELLKKLQSACKGVDFIARDITKTDTDIESVNNELESSKEEIDGVLIIGLTNEYRLAFTGLPTIYVNNLFEWMNTPYRLYITGKDEGSINWIRGY